VALTKLRKLTNNILTRRAPSVLGWPGYLRLCSTLARELPAIARMKDLRPLDRAMGSATDTFRYRGRTLRFDCAFADDVIRDGTYAFGIVREILIRDCYLRHLPRDTLTDLDSVVDLGANRGMFSMLSATFARRVLSVDANGSFRPVIEHNARINGFAHITIETAFVGAGGALGREAGDGRTDLSTLLDRHRFDAVDLLKVDIEGSEFALFESAGWLSRVRRLCMEVHAGWGRPEHIASHLRALGFNVTCADGDLRRLDSAHACEFLYAWR
jgi:hypothetical protein